MNLKNWDKTKKTIEQAMSPTGIKAFSPEKIFEILSDIEFEYMEIEGVNVYNKESALPQYIKTFPDVLKGHPLAILSFIHRIMSNDFVQGNGNIISLDEIYNTLNTVKSVFPEFEFVLNRVRTEIIVLDAEGWSVDGETVFYSDGKKLNSIIRLYQIRLETEMLGETKESILLHELGHLLHFSITSDVRKEPPGFRDYIANELKHEEYVDDDDIAEVFADTFVLAVLFKNEDITAELTKFPALCKEQAYNYINNLIKSI